VFDTVILVNGYEQHEVYARKFNPAIYANRQPKMPGGLRSGSAAARLLGMWVRIPPQA